MKESNELFELCKQAYEATGWKYTIGRFHDDGSYDGYVGHKGVAYTPNPQDAEWLPKDIPLYTSDYLLEKLPRAVKFYGDPASMSGSGYSYLSIERPVASNWCASYRYEGYPIHCGFGDTPLEALLRLTLKLHEEGLL